MEYLPLSLEEFASPGKLVGHLSYILLIVSMMMRSMTWLRWLAIASGAVSIAYGLFVLGDVVIVLWEIIFVAVNLVQLLLLWLSDRRARFSIMEAEFVAKVLPGINRGVANRLLQLAHLDVLPIGTRLTHEGAEVDELFYVADGAVRVDREGDMIGVCGHGDFIGEMAFLEGRPASATCTVTHELHCLRFNSLEVKALLARSNELRHALESAVGRDLMQKLIRSNAARPASKDAVSAAPDELAPHPVMDQPR